MLHRYVHGPEEDEPLVAYDGPGTGSRRWLLADERGSVIASADGGGSVTLAAFDDYGQGSPVSRFGFTGQAWLSEAGVYHFKARAYSPRLGRFLQPDPSADPSSPSTYAYGGNDPTNVTDPAGLAPSSFDPLPVKGVDVFGPSSGGFLGGGGGSGGGSNGVDDPQNVTIAGVTVTAGRRAPQRGGLRALLCSALPSGSTAGVAGALGGVGGVTGGVELVKNFNTGTTSVFGFGGFHVGWNGAASITAYTGAVYGLNGSNSNYSGGFTSANVSTPVGGAFAASSSGGYASARPDSKVRSVGMSAGVALVGGVTFGAAATKYTNPLRVGRFAGFNAVDMATFLARQLCR